MDASDKPPSTLVHRECRRAESLRYVALARLKATVVLRRLLERLELTVGIAG
jgi:hypothetical protein